MHMGALPFIAAQAAENFYHIIINNQVHESVGAMLTGSQETDFSKVAAATGYSHAERLETMEEIMRFNDVMQSIKGSVLFEIPVSLDSREDFGRPKESAFIVF